MRPKTTGPVYPPTLIRYKHVPVNTVDVGCPNTGPTSTRADDPPAAIGTAPYLY